jgi:MarR family transcriptional regulator, temperature-dependent positive regulator of motility
MTAPQPGIQPALPKRILECLQRQRGSIGFNMVLWGKHFSVPLYTEMEARFRISRDEFSVLASLYDCGSMSAKTICAITGRPKNSISRGVTRLMSMGRIRIVTNKSDRRQAVLSLVAEGRKLYERIIPLCREREALMLGSLSSTEASQLENILVKLLHSYLENPPKLRRVNGGERSRP